MYRLYAVLYTAPHVRVVPYLAGMLIGYLGHRLQKYPIELGKLPILLTWIAVIAYLITPIFFESRVDTISSLMCAIGYSIGKFIYGICVGILIMLCLFTPDTIVQRTLAHKVFVHLNKLCYGMYLVHPLVIILLFGLRTQPTYLTESLLVSHLTFLLLNFIKPIIVIVLF